MCVKCLGLSVSMYGMQHGWTNRRMDGRADERMSSVHACISECLYIGMYVIACLVGLVGQVALLALLCLFVWLCICVSICFSVV